MHRFWRLWVEDHRISSQNCIPTQHYDEEHKGNASIQRYANAWRLLHLLILHTIWQFQIQIGSSQLCVLILNVFYTLYFSKIQKIQLCLNFHSLIIFFTSFHFVFKNYLFFKLNFSYSFCGWMDKSWHMYRSQKITCRCWLSLSIMWVLRIKVGLSSIMTSAFTWWAISSAYQ